MMQHYQANCRVSGQPADSITHMNPTSKFIASNKGSAYLYILLVVMLIGVMMGRVGTTWKQVIQREKEEELLFRGMQIQEAIARWQQPQAGVQQHVATPLTDLKYLLKDPRTPNTVRYLRRLYNDPMTGGDWNLIKDPARGIVGVASSSKEQVIKKDNFPEQLQTLSNKERYEEWQFLYQQTRQQPVATIVTTGKI